jgi:NAD(P)-dependent dehydrogenase (short-subunit alcohol dehydrogenase family)
MTQPTTVLITGCSSGIGHATAERLAAAGWTVYATARRPETLAQLEARGCRTLALDVTDEASMQAAVSAIEGEHGSIGALVNNAGYSQSGAVETVPMEKVRTQFETNVFGLMRLCQLVLPGMRRARAGRIVNLSSMGGRLVFPGGGVYHATKYAVEALSDALRFEVKGFGIDVILVEPGLIRTEFGTTAAGGVSKAAAGEGDYAQFNAHVAAATEGIYESGGPIARLGGPPEAVAKVIDKVLSAKRPRARYTVTPSAKLLIANRAVLPDRAWDALMRQQFPSPGA